MRLQHIPHPIKDCPYSTAVQFDNLLYLSGVVSEDIEKDIALKGDIEYETRNVLNNIKTILEKNNSSLSNVIKVDVYMTDMNDFGGMNKVYKEFFPRKRPARHAFQVADLCDGLKIEIVVLACINDE